VRTRDGRRRSQSASRILLGIGAALSLAAASVAREARTLATPGESRARTSYAVGFSTGASFRDLLPVSIGHFHQGLLDGLGGEATRTRVMARPELMARLRLLLERVADAERMEVARRIDREAEH
jgi:hypothetical protein